MKRKDFRKENIDKHVFSTIDPIEFSHNKACYRVSESDLKSMPDTEEQKQAELRELIIELFEEKLGGSYVKIQEYCDIGRTAFSKYIHGKNGISKVALTKIAIGLKLSQEEYEHLLALNSTPFDYDCRFDFIAACELREHDELETFYEDLRKHGCKDIETQ
jgi:hypothetical protein